MHDCDRTMQQKNSFASSYARDGPVNIGSMHRPLSSGDGVYQVNTVQAASWSVNGRMDTFLLSLPNIGIW